MTGGSVMFTLNDGETLVVTDEDARRAYDALWGFGGERGAVSTAALLKDALRLRPPARRPVVLTTPQSALLRNALALIHS